MMPTTRWKLGLSTMLTAILLMTSLSAANAAEDSRWSTTTGPDVVAGAPDSGGFLYRGDSRAPTDVFDRGFQPQGTNANLQQHLSFAGDSAYVSTSVRQASATNYVYGRSAEQNELGYLYVIAPAGLRGHFVPALFPNDPAARGNQEFAVGSAIAGDLIVGAYTFTRGLSEPTAWTPNPNYAYRSSHPFNQDTGSNLCTRITAMMQSICSLACPSSSDRATRSLPPFDGACTGIHETDPIASTPSGLRAIAALDGEGVRVLAWGGGSASNWGGRACIYGPIDAQDVGAWSTGCSTAEYHGYSDEWRLNVRVVTSSTVEFTLEQGTQCLNADGGALTMNSCGAAAARFTIDAQGKIRSTQGYLLQTANTLYWAKMYGYVFFTEDPSDSWSTWAIERW